MQKGAISEENIEFRAMHKADIDDGIKSKEKHKKQSKVRMIDDVLDNEDNIQTLSAAEFVEEPTEPNEPTESGEPFEPDQIVQEPVIVEPKKVESSPKKQSYINAIKSMMSKHKVDDEPSKQDKSPTKSPTEILHRIISPKHRSRSTPQIGTPQEYPSTTRREESPPTPQSGKRGSPTSRSTIKLRKSPRQESPDRVESPKKERKQRSPITNISPIPKTQIPSMEESHPPAHTKIVIEEKKEESEGEELHARQSVITKMEKIEAKYKKKWVTREMAELLGRELLLMSTLRDTILFILFLIFATIINLGVIEPETYHLFGLMEEELLIKNDFYTIHTPDQFWDFVEIFFDSSFYWDYWYYPDHKIFQTNEFDRNIFYENKMIGVPRLRQLRVRGDSCVIHTYFKRTFMNCYGKFNAHNEDTSSFGLKSGSAWEFTEETDLLETRHWGKFGWYHGGGYHQDLSLSRNETLETIQVLKNNLWITRHTRVIFLDWTLYNTNLNLFMQFRLTFEFPRSGGIVPQPTTHICSLIRYVNRYDYFIMACELICVLFIIWYTAEEIREMIYFRWSYFRKFWSWMDLMVILFGLIAIGIRINAEISVRQKLQSLLDEPDQHAKMAGLMRTMLYYKLILAWQLFFIYMKIFKYLNFNKSMAQLSRTLMKCRRDMFGFAIMFFVIFIAFAILGYIIFGTEVESFSTFSTAMFTLLRTILGDFDYTVIEQANRILAPIFFILFIFLVFFVLLNMFLAIINDTYIDVKTELSIAPEELQMTGFIKRGYYNLLIKMGCLKRLKEDKFQENEYKMTTNEIKSALRKVGFTDVEIEMFFARYNIDEEAKIKDFNVDTLLQILEGNIAEVPKQEGKPHKADELDDPLIMIDDFKKQQRQLQSIENNLNETTAQLRELLSHLEKMDNVRKIALDDVKGVNYLDSLNKSSLQREDAPESRQK